MEELTKLFKILSDLNRLRIIALLMQRKMCVCEIAFALGVTQPAVSRHLKKMKAVGLVGDEQDGFWTNYSLKWGNEHKVVLDYVGGWLKENAQAARDFERLKGFDKVHSCKIDKKSIQGGFHG